MSVFLSRVLCVSRQYFSAKFARPLFSDRFTLRLLLTRYFALYSALRAPTGPGGRTEPTELCSLSRKLIILFVTDNKYFTHDSQSQPAQLQRIKSRLKGSNCPPITKFSKRVLIFIVLRYSLVHIYMITFLLDATYSRKIVYCVQLYL